MIVIPRKGRNRIPLTGLLHIFLFPLLFLAGIAVADPAPRLLLAQAEEVPYVTTPDRVTAAMLDLAAVQAGDHVIDLGSGDGRIVIAAARRGATGLGVDNDPRLVAESIGNAKRAGVAARTTFLEQDLFRTDLAPATVITLYLLPEVNLQLRPAILRLRPGTRIVSHDWDMGDWRPDRSVTLAVPEKTIGLSKSSKVHLWIVPARVEGLWCGTRDDRRAALRLRQSYQDVSGEIEIGGRSRMAISGGIAGTSVSVAPSGAAAPGSLRFVARAAGMQSVQADGELSGLRGFAWRRAHGKDAC